MKKIIALLLAVMMVLAMAACAAKTTDTPAPAETDNKTDAVQETATEAAADGKTELNIGVLVWKYSDTYGSSVRVAMDKYAKEIGAEKGLTLNLEMQDGTDDQATQNNQADVMFAAGKDHIIINLCDTSAGQYLVDLAKQYNVPISFYNKEPVDSAIVTGSNSIFVGVGERSREGRELYDEMKEAGLLDKMTVVFGQMAEIFLCVVLNTFLISLVSYLQKFPHITDELLIAPYGIYSRSSAKLFNHQPGFPVILHILKSKSAHTHAAFRNGNHKSR